MIIGLNWFLGVINVEKVFSTRPELHQDDKVKHHRVKLTNVQGEKYPCLRCPRQFLSESMFVSHSRDHDENIHGCNECMWHFNSIAGLVKQCGDTHDDRHYACTTCGENFRNNADLCRHTTKDHIELCQICCSSFVSEEKLARHVAETHPGAAVHSREQMIEDERLGNMPRDSYIKNLRKGKGNTRRTRSLEALCRAVFVFVL